MMKHTDAKWYKALRTSEGEPLAFSEYIVYVDESGDHGLERFDSNFPLFVLAFCVFKKSEYLATAVPVFQRFKFDQFGHDLVILHEREIRKAVPPFDLVLNEKRRDAFYAGLNSAIEAAPFKLIAGVINKPALKKQYAFPGNPYELAMKFCLERLQFELGSGGIVHVVFEGRGKNEDDALELEFRRLCDSKLYPFVPVFAHKVCNSTGLQIADLVARPIGRHVLDPKQENRAFEILQKKFRKSPSGLIAGWGLKVFP